jgi:oligosaccharyltransferase complex subunit beta
MLLNDGSALAQDLSSQSIVSLLSANPPVNFLIALGTSTTQLTSLASEFSLSLPPPNTPLVSHFPPRDVPHTVIPIDIPPPNLALPKSQQPAPILKTTQLKAPILFSGIPFYIGNNPLLVPILRAPAESFATDTESDKGADVLVEAAEKGGEGLWTGADLHVVTGFQARSGGRVVWAGGVDLFSDEYAKAQNKTKLSSEVVP